MATETLRIDITAEQKQALAELKLMDDRLVSLQKQLKKTTDVKGVIRLQDEIRGLKNEMDALSKTASNNVTKGSNQAANALTNLGRVAQDAPFGFIGIQNNLNPLLESFQRLKAESGSTGGALKALAGSLIGPAGLGLALSVGSALLLAFGDKMMAASGETKKLNEAQEALSKTLSDNLGAAKAEVGQMQILTSIINDNSKSVDVRTRALDELKKAYPGYEALQKVDIKDTAALAKVTDTLSAAIMRKARVEAYSALIAQEEAKQAKFALETDKQRADRLGFLSKAIKDYAVPLLKLASPTAFNIAQTELQSRALDEASDAFDFGNKIIGSYTGTLKKLKEEQLLNNDSTILGGAVTKAQTEKVTKAAKAVRDYTADIAKARASFQSLGQGQTVGTAQQSDTSFGAVGPSQAMIDRTMAVQAATKVQMDYANALRLTTMNEEAAAAMTNVAMSAFTSLGNAMLQGQDIGEALGNVFKKLIIDLTQMVIRALMLKAIMAALSGGASEATTISGGSGMAAMFNGMPISGGGGGGGGGGGFLDILKSLMGFSDGGIASGPKSGYPVMLHGTEAVLNPKQFKNLTSNMMNMGALQSQGSNQSGGSSQVILRGQDLVLALQRAGVNLDLRRGN